MQINTNYQKPAHTTAFSGKHLPRGFSSLMNYLYKNSQKHCENVFEYRDTVHISTTLQNGKQASGIVNFLNGKYAGLHMDDGCGRYRQQFIRTVLEKFNKSVAKGNTRRKLGY